MTLQKYLGGLKYYNKRVPPEQKVQVKLKNHFSDALTSILQHNTIEAVLERGEKLDDLVSKSEGLSIQSKAFYKTARKTNSCCNFG